MWDASRNDPVENQKQRKLTPLWRLDVENAGMLVSGYMMILRRT